MRKRWVIKKHERQAIAALASELDLTPLVAALLISRGYGDPESASRFLRPAFEQLHDPTRLKDIDKSTDRILKAIAAGEKILIWGDYDVDGTTGTVLLRRALKLLGATTGFHVPNRFTEGYGLNIPAIEKYKAEGYTLLITVDCGIKSFEPVRWAQDHGIDVIITDHHLSDDQHGNPPAFAVVNPNQKDCEYPDKHLAGVGVAFKLVQRLLTVTGHERHVQSFLKVAAIGTVADIMDLTGENRVIVSLGLRDLPTTSNWGLKALMEVSNCDTGMTSYHIGFRIAPRINAAGRMDIARHVVDLFEADNFDQARKLATMLDSRNRERQQVQQSITELAIGESSGSEHPYFVVVAGNGWHRGVIGLAASRIVEKVYRPAIVLSVENGIAHGSARSIKDFHLVSALDSCGELLEQYGGHAAAAGMTIRADRIDELRRRLNEYAKTALSDDLMVPQLDIDALVTTESLTLKLVEDLAQFEPFGAGNPKPIFLTRGLVLRDEPFVMKEKHLKLWLTDAAGKRFEAVWWNGVERSEGQTLSPGARIEVAYSPEANVWQGNTRLQLVVEDLRVDN